MKMNRISGFNFGVGIFCAMAMVSLLIRGDIIPGIIVGLLSVINFTVAFA